MVIRKDGTIRTEEERPADDAVVYDFSACTEEEYARRLKKRKKRPSLPELLCSGELADLFFGEQGDKHD